MSNVVNWDKPEAISVTFARSRFRLLLVEEPCRSEDRIRNRRRSLMPLSVRRMDVSYHHNRNPLWWALKVGRLETQASPLELTFGANPPTAFGVARSALLASVEVGSTLPIAV